MCWSFEVSLGTLIFATVGSIYLYGRNEPNDRLYALYIFTIGLMQGTDALGWYSIDNSIPTLNKFSAVLSRIFIALPIPAIYWYLYKTTGEKIYSNVVFAFLVYILFVGYKIWNEYDSFNISLNPTCKNECHLEWSWLYKMTDVKYWIVFIIYSLLMVYPLLLFNDKRQYFMIGIPVLTLLYALYKFSDTQAWGSYWCAAINMWVLGAVFGKSIRP
jgi:hypothetical protein